MEALGFIRYRKIGNPSKKRDLKMTHAQARVYGWEPDEDPKPIVQSAPKEPFKTPPMPEIAKAAIPVKAEVPKVEDQSTDEMPEVTIPKKTPAKRGPRKTSTK